MKYFIILLLIFNFGCIRKYEVKFDIYAPDALAQESTNYQGVTIHVAAEVPKTVTTTTEAEVDLSPM